ncbi:hypothetical protein QBC35DRAFT_450365 [Podospora australis]|uniref:UspA domain-containing protein n=1 Tax=Podospora australis TaxID=1536484 RepID=A0AAN6WXB3_9PEZI|nr:hypothetical protein QBC35DRAFT_450365 [Podospora australis]
MARHQPMSMEAMLDEERREVLALLEGTPANKPRAPSSIASRSSSPFNTPRSPVRSMLNIGDEPPSPGLLSPYSPSYYTKTPSPRTAPVRSMLDVDSPPAPPVRSMLDVDTPPGAKMVLSTPSSPIESSSRSHSTASSTHPRSMSDAALRPADFGPRANPRHDPTLDYQFSGIITNHAGAALPKRVSQGGKRSHAMAEVMRGNDVSGLVLPGDRGRHSIAGGPSIRVNNKSKSPTSRLGVRSHSPHTPLLGRPLSPAGRAMLGDNQSIDMNSAYRRLSDAALARSGGSLGQLGRRKKSDDASGNGRLAKDYLGPDGELLVEESSDDNGASSSDEDERGRKAARSFDKKSQSNSESPEAKRQARSLLAAAEEERVQVASQQPQPTYTYRSLLDDPKITVTNPSGEKERVKHSKPQIHPATSFDSPPSGTHTPMYTDTEEDISDIKRAQKLSFAMTQIMETPESHRTIQIITRGDYAKLVKEAEEEHRPPRKYLVATDMSDESTHALEWAIGTVLRDGDTLLAIYCVDEESGIGAGDNSLVPDEPKAMKEQAAAINAVTNNKVSGIPIPLRSSPLGHQASEASLSPAPSSVERSKAEDDRYRAVKDIGDRAMKLLRKTRLQVRVIVEVLHCKNPKHLITEVIDLVNPTLVILGSRGRSALKGVILGSFSNYLVTKSSVPVMVARKKLRKQSKYKKIAAQHQVNNINNPSARSLANAKID